MTNTFVHDFSPFAIKFPQALQMGTLHLEGIRWYGLAYLAGFISGYWVIRFMIKQGTTTMKKDEIADFITTVAIGTMVGGRLGYCIFYAPHLLTDFSSSPPFWGVLKVYEGGMASHGGILGVVLSCLWWAKKRKVNLFHILDLVTFGGSLGIFFGRLANFINGELWGREAPADLTWAVKFPSEIYSWTKESLNKLMEISPAVDALGKISINGEPIQVNSLLWKNWVQNYRTNMNAWNMVNEVIEKMIQATQSGQQEVIAALAPYLTPRYPSQLIQAGLEGLLVFFILSVIWLKPRKPGIVSAWFGILYCMARIIGEQFRMPDQQIGFQWLGLTRGQWLSVVMLALVLVYMFYVRSKSTSPMGGWKQIRAQENQE
ncbi:MAG: prolipoprotein diacylglyceryl transferase [Bdellovibrionales bacterium]|nr:prolipoprotein diacylglyceryl transferase [Bdellovibrionales bacterium]